MDTSFPDAGHDTLVVGGGDLLSDDPAGPWKAIKPWFRPRGRHVLNAVGVDPAAVDRLDLSYLSEYRMVTVRDDLASLGNLVARVDNVRSVPCPATLVEPLPWEVLCSLPEHGPYLRGLEPGGYVVVHRHQRLHRAAVAVLRRRLPVLVVDVQHHRRQPWVLPGCRVVPVTHSPAVVMTLVANAMAVLTVSLHLAVFALGTGAPFAVRDHPGYQLGKIHRYLARAGIEEAITAQADMLDHALALTDRALAAGRAETAAAVQHLDELAALLH